MISIIVRTKNEERWIAQCLQKIMTQSFKDFEIILVDNKSTDKTVEKALHICPELKLIEIEHYLPGAALNKGIEASRGEYIVCLSAHCLPVNEHWLENFLLNFSNEQIAGVYGRQIPMRFSSSLDKRDLLVTFGLDKRVHKKDSFFHNANSMIRRKVWDKYPFDEKVTNIEDRVWGKVVIDAGYTIIYEPEASVYHHHGIHQSNDKKRSEGVVRILDDLDLVKTEPENEPLTPEKLEITALIPLRQHNTPDHSIDKNEELVTRTIQAAVNSKYIDQVIISSDSKEIAEKAAVWGASAPFIRPLALSANNVRVNEVLKYSLHQLEEQGYFPDLIVPLEITYPFRPVKLLDNIIELLLEKGLDSVIAGLPEYRPCWVNKNDELIRIDDFIHIRDKREPVLIGLPSLGCVTYPEFIRKSKRLGNKVGIFEIDDPRASLEIRTNHDYEILKKWL